MQAKLQRRKTPRRHQSAARPPQREKPILNPPVQNPPVDRLYMRPVVGRKGKPKQPEQLGETARKGTKAPNSEHGRPSGDFMVELTTFPVRPRWPRGPL
jgi:hypothetical protein